MSTVALRGILAYDENTEEWSWSGRWVFGDCVPVPLAPVLTTVVEGSSVTSPSRGEVVAAATSSSKSKSNNFKKQKDTSQPFLYKWQEASDPSTIPVPSLNVKIIGEVEEESPKTATVEPEPVPQRTPEVDNKTSTTKEEDSLSSDKIALGTDRDSRGENKPQLTNTEILKKETTKTDVIVGSDRINPSIDTSAGSQGTKLISSTNTPAAPTGLKSSSNTHLIADAGRCDQGKEDKKKINDEKNSIRIEDKPVHVNEQTKMTNIAIAGQGSPPPSLTKILGEKETKAQNSTSLPDDQQENASTDKSVRACESSNNATKKEEETVSEITPTKESTPTATQTMVASSKAPEVKPEEPTEIMFTSLMPKFLDASLKFNSERDKIDRCPSSGQWKGYFENVIPSKKSGRNKSQQPPQIQKIDETFYLFLNATPSSSSGTKMLDNSDANGNENRNDIANSSSRNSEENGKDDPGEDLSVDLFAFESATKDHIPKIINLKSAKKIVPGQSSTESSTNTDTNSGTPVPTVKPTIKSENGGTGAKEMISLVQVKGCGENEFGTFEIMGYLDLNTMVMEIQRQYVVTEVPAVSPVASSRRRRSLSNPNTGDEGPRPHSTRKRNPTWKRASYDPEEDRRRKRNRSLIQKHSQGDEMSIEPTTASDSPASSIPFTTTNQDLTPSSGSMSGKFKLNPPSTTIPMTTLSGSSVSSSLNKTGSVGEGSKSRFVLPTQSKVKVNPANNSSVGSAGGRRRSSTGGSGGGVRTKRRSSTTGKSTASSKSNSTYIRLPSVGDPKKARWRAAHFLYYQRDDPDQRAQQQQQQPQSSNNANPSGNNGPTTNSNKIISPKPKYVIYEGEMVDSKREGRGICLYTDGNLYEGEWKRDKEHGYGKLMSSDRKRIIYEGEWERGRMQGTGTYYYGSSDPLKPGSRYIGEFRENLRNGIGRYFLPDGSVYDGQWRDGVMNGLGVFTWPDHSMYDGVWKDGKRYGQGLLKKADGFVYDGQWVNNTMEGRGSAIYPNGQRYEGSFSNGRREGRGTIIFTNGAVYEGRFRDDAVDGQGTMKMSRTMIVPREDRSMSHDIVKMETKGDHDGNDDKKEDFMIPISFQSDMTRILTKTGFM